MLLCRVCLVGDIKLRTIQSPELKETYQLLAKNQVVMREEYPHTMCYICYSLLQKCCKFSEMCHKSAKILQYLFNNGIGASHESLSNFTIENSFNLSVSVRPTISIDHTPELTSMDELEVSEQVNVKAEEEEEECTTKLVGDECIEMRSVKKEPEEYDGFVECEMQGLQYEENLKNPLELEAENKEGIVKLPTSILLKQLMKCNDKKHASYKPPTQQELTNETCEKNANAERNTEIKIEPIPQTSTTPMDETDNVPAKLMQSYKCEGCHKMFHRQYDIDIQNGIQLFACNKCDKRFSQMAQLNQHIQYEHTGFRKSMCKACNKILKLKAESKKGTVCLPTTMLLKQLKKYNDNKRACFKPSTKQQQPTRETCVNSAKVQRNTEIKIEPIPQTSTNPMEETLIVPAKQMQSYKCKVCHKVFQRQCDIDLHMRIHNGVKLFACNKCDKRFFQMAQLNLHIRYEHTGYCKTTCKFAKYLNKQIN